MARIRVAWNLAATAGDVSIFLVLEPARGLTWWRHLPPLAKQVKDFETFRKKLPQGVELIVAKNTLVEKAIEGTKFAPLKAACKGTNAFLFAGEEVAGRCALGRLRLASAPCWRRGCGPTSSRDCGHLRDLQGTAAATVSREQTTSCASPAEKRPFAVACLAASRPSTRCRRR